MPYDLRDELIPNPMDTDTQFYRFHNLDLDKISDIDLADEYHYLRGQLWQLSPNHWLRQRVTALEGELTKRRQVEHFFRDTAVGHDSQKRPLAGGVRL